MQVRVLAVVSIMLSPCLTCKVSHCREGLAGCLHQQRKWLMNWVILLNQSFISVLFSLSTARLEQQGAFSLVTAPHVFSFWLNKGVVVVFVFLLMFGGFFSLFLFEVTLLGWPCALHSWKQSFGCEIGLVAG